MSKYFEELEPGQHYKHAVTRTVTEVDNLMFTALSHNDQPLHLDEEFGKTTMYGSRVCNSLFTMAFVNGATVSDLTLGTTLGNLGYEEVRFPNPVRIGDTLRSESKIISKRSSKKYPNAGIVIFEHIGYNQRNDIVVTMRRAGLMMKIPKQEAE
ncbi:MAG: MaoC family dehydratase [Halieaceae bacterium]|nr:MaoC family dehydratase [Halieaceae bacterium]